MSTPYARKADNDLRSSGNRFLSNFMPLKIGVRTLRFMLNSIHDLNSANCVSVKPAS